MSGLSKIHLVRKVQNADSSTAIPLGDRWWLDDELLFPVDDLFERLELQRGEIIPQEASWAEQLEHLSKVIANTSTQLRELEAKVLLGNSEDQQQLQRWTDVFHLLVEGLSSLSSVGVSSKDAVLTRDYFVSIVWG